MFVILSEVSRNLQVSFLDWVQKIKLEQHDGVLWWWNILYVECGGEVYYIDTWDKTAQNYALT